MLHLTLYTVSWTLYIDWTHKPQSPLLVTVFVKGDKRGGAGRTLLYRLNIISFTFSTQWRHVFLAILTGQGVETAQTQSEPLCELTAVFVGLSPNTQVRATSGRHSSY